MTVGRIVKSMINIVGIGPGSSEYILPVAKEIISKADLVIGFERAIDSVKNINNSYKKVKKIDEIIEEIKINEEKDLAIIASGDPCFYGVTNYIQKNYQGNINVIPGISSFQYMTCKLKMPWQESFLGSLHGREQLLLCLVKENYRSIFLTDSKHSAEFICLQLFNNNIKAKVYVGENLSYEDEKITIGTAEELKNRKFSGFSIVIIENKELPNNDLYKG